MAEYTLSAEPTHSVWNRDLAPRLTIDSSDTVHFHCTDASGGQVHPGMTAEEFTAIDRTRIHALTGPVAIHGAEPGDVLEVDILEVRHLGWGWTSIITGLGFLKERFTQPYLFHWQLEGEVSHSLAPAIVPLRPFCGVMGVAPPEPGEFRTRPPGAFGGNMDVRDLSTGAKLYLPIFNAGALFSCGDAHAAQGDGEVCINGIECPSEATLRFRLHKGKSIPAPILEAPPRRAHPEGEWIVVESHPDAATAARNATSRIIDLIASHWGILPEHAYILCSVAMDLRLSQVVNEPMVTVAAALPKSILPARSLF
ncbi:acetamidase/formamidase family protein [Silvibacterium sp.]|uniref:acetamidase/formamidase family protein n=1 Tax=Silvibacterium sp. TaxID=1964179 RepID=UPI0039E6B622